MVSNLICFLNNKKNQGVIAFFIVVMVFILFQQHKNIMYFPSDSGDYWKLSATTTLKDFPKESFRGYFFPLLLWPAHWLTDVLQVSTPLMLEYIHLSSMPTHSLSFYQIFILKYLAG